MKKNFSARVRPGILYATITFLCASLIFFSCKKTTQNTVGLAPTADAGINFSAATLTYNYTNLFNGGDGAYHSYRIPSLIRTTKGTMLAVCEGRKNSSADYGDIDVVCRRLLSGASSWETTRHIIAGGNTGDTDTWGNPTLVVNQVDGKIWLFMSWNDRNHSQGGAGGLSPINAWGQRRVYACYSTATQDGSAWSAPVDMTATLLPSNYAWDGMGPGIGIQKTQTPNINRMIIPAIGRNIYSDDNGVTWNYSLLPAGGSNSEATIAELKNGTLMRNDRPTNSYYRKVSSGQIGNWTQAFTDDTSLPDPRCEASIFRYNMPAPNRIFFLNSNSQTQRRVPYIRITYDEGGTWPIGRSIPQNGTGILGGYTSLSKTPDLMTGALIEYNQNNTAGNLSIQYHKFNLSWILNGATEPAGY
jgi:sialidase-1